MRFSRHVLAIGVTALVTVGCSGDATDDTERPPPTTTATPGDATSTSTTSTSTTATTTGPTTTAVPSTTEPVPPTTAEPTAPTDRPAWVPIDTAAGRWLAFTSIRTGVGELFAVDVATGEERQLTELGSPDGVYQPAWSPDGSAIAFQCSSDLLPPDPDGGLGASDICLLDLVSGDITDVTRDADPDQDPQWSPDGHGLAFLTLTADGPMVRFVELDGSDPRVLTSGLAPAWAPAGALLAAIDGDALVVVDVAAGDRRVLVPGDVGSSRPAWSPQGAELAFACVAGDASSDGFVQPADICAVSADGSTTRVVTDAATVDAAPIWSPDGTAIAFTATEALGAQPDVYVAPAAGGGARRVASGDLPAWSPDGALLAFRPSGGGIAVVDGESGEITSAVIDPSAGDIAWSRITTPSGS